MLTVKIVQIRRRVGTPVILQNLKNAVVVPSSIRTGQCLHSIICGDKLNTQAAPQKISVDLTCKCYFVFTTGFQIPCISPFEHECHSTVADPRFPRGGGANPLGGAPTYYLANFSQKLHEDKEMFALGGRGACVPRAPLDPPLL